jgi:hypothetical protein
MSRGARWGGGPPISAKVVKTVLYVKHLHMRHQRIEQAEIGTARRRWIVVVIAIGPAGSRGATVMVMTRKSVLGTT